MNFVRWGGEISADESLPARLCSETGKENFIELHAHAGATIPPAFFYAPVYSCQSCAPYLRVEEWFRLGIL
jgi:hypothetical protein